MFKQLLILLILASGSCMAQQEISLYMGPVPNSKHVANEEQKSGEGKAEIIITKVSIPTLSVFLPSKEKANGRAVIICPGGGYHALVSKREGADIAKAFNELGMAAFVLKYRLPSDRTMKDKSIGPLQDAQQAIKTVRQRAREWNIDPEKIGIMGFSAGGHLAATAGTHFDHPVIENPEGISLRPDFMILVYPVISFADSIGHIGSRRNLLGDAPSGEQIRYFSNDLHVDKFTPPTFLTHAGDDTVVPLANSMEFYQALKKNGIPADLHIYSKGEHGYLQYPSFEEWFGRCANWIKTF